MLDNIVVAKFGGSSLADAGQFKKVKSIVLSDERRRFIVPSAPGKRNNDDYKITDLLYKCSARVSAGESFDDLFDIIAIRYMGIVNELSLELDIEKHLKEVRGKIGNGASPDYAASRGEYLSGLILSAYLGFDFIDAADMIRFDESGSFDPKGTQSLVEKTLSGVEKAVIPGFYGSMPDGELKTFSRGGSDISGAIIAGGIGASLYENWTDVSGFLMADPRIVDKPKTMKSVTYKELRELSYMGATVLHEDAIFPVRKAGVPINIKNTNDPGHPGTLIINDLEPGREAGSITGIAGKKEFTVIAIEKTMMNAEIGFGRRLLTVLEDHNISFEHMPTGIDTMSLIISDTQLDGMLDTIIGEIEEKCKPDSIQVYPDMALIATVGRGMAYTVGMASKIFTALSSAGVNVRMIDQGSSEINIIVGVETKDFEKAVNGIYNQFVR